MLTKIFVIVFHMSAITLLDIGYNFELIVDTVFKRKSTHERYGIAHCHTFFGNVLIWKCDE